MDFGQTLLNFCQDLEIGRWTSYGLFERWYEFTPDEFHKIRDLGIVTNAREGGLVLGNLHVDGGVHLIKPNLKAGMLTYVGEMEGWEYMTAPISTNEVGEKFKEINSRIPRKGVTDEETDFQIPDGCKVIDTIGDTVPFLLVSEYSQFVVNRFATKKYIKELIELDKINVR